MWDCGFGDRDCACVVAYRSITRPLSEGVIVAQKIAEGDLTARIETVGTDETGQLMSALKNMVTKLQSIIGEVKNRREKHRFSEPSTERKF